jgi:hypothetical protein
MVQMGITWLLRRKVSQASHMPKDTMPPSSSPTAAQQQQPMPVTSVPTPQGYKNLGNTCWIASVLHVIEHTPGVLSHLNPDSDMYGMVNDAIKTRDVTRVVAYVLYRLQLDEKSTVCGEEAFLFLMHHLVHPEQTLQDFCVIQVKTLTCVCGAQEKITTMETVVRARGLSSIGDGSQKLRLQESGWCKICQQLRKCEFVFEYEQGGRGQYIAVGMGKNPVANKGVEKKCESIEETFQYSDSAYETTAVILHHDDISIGHLTVLIKVEGGNWIHFNDLIVQRYDETNISTILLQHVRGGVSLVIGKLM